MAGEKGARRSRGETAGAELVTRGKTPTLALAIIVKDEEKHLSRCLDSVVDVVDEMVIVDTGSSDSTKEIAESYDHRVPRGVKVLDFKWCDDFSAARNFGLEQVQADWVIQLDADEELAEGFESLRDILRDKTVEAYYVRLIAAKGVEDAKSSGQAFAPIRLFRNRPDRRYRHIIHEGIELSERDRAIPSDLLIIHFGPMIDDRSDRPERNIKLLNRVIKNQPDNAYFRAALGNEYFLIGDHERAVESFAAATELKPDAELIWVISMWRNQVLALANLGRKDESATLLRDLQVRYSDYTDLFYLDGVLSLEAGNRTKAIEMFQTCLRMGDPPGFYETWGGTGSTRAQKGLLTARMGGKV